MNRIRYLHSEGFRFIGINYYQNDLIEGEDWKGQGGIVQLVYISGSLQFSIEYFETTETEHALRAALRKMELRFA